MRGEESANRIWKRFYECDCGAELIMLSYDYEEEGLPMVDLAWFTHSVSRSPLTLKEKIRWCWHILIKGEPFADMVTLKQKMAAELGEALIEFSKKSYKMAKEEMGVKK